MSLLQQAVRRGRLCVKQAVHRGSWVALGRLYIVGCVRKLYIVSVDFDNCSSLPFEIFSSDAIASSWIHIPCKGLLPSSFIYKHTLPRRI